MNITNFQSGLETDLALDADTEFMRTRNLQIGIDRKDRTEITRYVVICRVCQRECDGRRSSHGRKVRESEVSACRRYLGRKTGISDQSIVGRPHKFVIYIAQTITAAEDSLAIAWHKFSKESFFKIR